jgi:hypothetical protein
MELYRGIRSSVKRGRVKPRWSELRLFLWADQSDAPIDEEIVGIGPLSRNPPKSGVNCVMAFRAIR